MFFKEVSSAYQGCIYLMEKTNNNNNKQKNSNIVKYYDTLNVLI